MIVRLIIILGVLPVMLFAQHDRNFSFEFDASGNNLNNLLTDVIIGKNDTIYTLGSYINPPNEIPFICKISPDGEMVSNKTIDAIPLDRGNFLFLSKDTIVIFDSPDQDANLPRFRLTFLDTKLNLIKELNYYASGEIISMQDKDIYINNERIFLFGSKSEKSGFRSGVAMYIDRQSLNVDTIIEPQFGGYADTDYLQGYEEDGKVNILYGFRTVGQPGIGFEVGFLRIDENYNFEYNEIPPVSNLYSSQIVSYNYSEGFVIHADTVIYDTLPEPDAYILFDNYGERKWETLNWPGRWGATAPRVADFTQTENDDIIAFGGRGWHLNYDGQIWFLPPDAVRFFTAFAVRLGGLTGDKKWNHVYYGFDNEGRLKVYSFKGMKELKDGDLVGVGVSAIQDSLGQLLNINSWIIRMPGHGCFLDNCDDIESFLTKTNDVNPSQGSVSIYPNPAMTTINIKFMDDMQISALKYKLYTLEGIQVKGSNLYLSPNGQIDISSLTPGGYILTLIDEKNRTQHSIKFVKSDI